MDGESFHNGIKSVHSAAITYEIYTFYKFHKTSFGQERTNETWNFPSWNKVRTLCGIWLWNAWMLWCIFHIQTISSYDSFKDITKQNEIGIKSVHITAFVSSYDSFKDITKQNQIWIKSVHIAALDYEMHEYYDAFSYSNNYFALNDLILILSPIISVWHHVKPNFIQS